MGDGSECLSDAAAVSHTVHQLLQKHRSRLGNSGNNNRTCLSNGVSPATAHSNINGKDNNNNSNKNNDSGGDSDDNIEATGPSAAATGPRRPQPIGSGADDASGFETESAPPSTAGDWNDDGNDVEMAELAALRCQSVRTEVVAEKLRRKNRCADYPGFAFGFSLFSSDTMMKFNIIKNELHNIKNNLLKRVRWCRRKRRILSLGDVRAPISGSFGRNPQRPNPHLSFPHSPL